MKHVYSFWLFCLCTWTTHANSKETLNHHTLNDNNNCGLNTKAAELAQLIINHDTQKRTKLICHAILAKTAAEKARSMAVNRRIEHILDLKAPNQLIESYGYALPAEFLPTSNQVESVAGGSSSPRATLNALLESQGHRDHLLGISSFNQKQIHIGVGYYYDRNTPHEHHWVIHIAQPRNKPKAKLTVDYLKSVINYQAKPSE